MLVFPVNSPSIQESNIFLRKLWSELNQVKPLGWCMCPYRKGNQVTIGTSILGEISYDYTQKGYIKNIYIDNSKDADAITIAIRNAKENEMKKCSIFLELKNSEG